MPFRRFFDRGAKRESSLVNDPSLDEAEAPEEPSDRVEDEEGDEVSAGVEGEPEDATEVNWLERAVAVEQKRREVAAEWWRQPFTADS